MNRNSPNTVSTNPSQQFPKTDFQLSPKEANKRNTLYLYIKSSFHKALAKSGKIVAD